MAFKMKGHTLPGPNQRKSPAKDWMWGGDKYHGEGKHPDKPHDQPEPRPEPKPPTPAKHPIMDSMGIRPKDTREHYAKVEHDPKTNRHVAPKKEVKPAHETTHGKIKSPAKQDLKLMGSTEGVSEAVTKSQINKLKGAKTTGATEGVSEAVTQGAINKLKGAKKKSTLSKVVKAHKDLFTGVSEIAKTIKNIKTIKKLNKLANSDLIKKANIKSPAKHKLRASTTERQTNTAQKHNKNAGKPGHHDYVTPKKKSPAKHREWRMSKVEVKHPHPHKRRNMKKELGPKK